MSLQPLRDFLVVTVTKSAADEKLGGGLLYKPATIDEKVVTGTVVAVGSGHITDTGIVPLEVKAGDTILFNKQMTVEVKHNGETFHLLREEHILSAVR